MKRPSDDRLPDPSSVSHAAPMVLVIMLKTADLELASMSNVPITSDSDQFHACDLALQVTTDGASRRNKYKIDSTIINAGPVTRQKSITELHYNFHLVGT